MLLKRESSLTEEKLSVHISVIADRGADDNHQQPPVTVVCFDRNSWGHSAHLNNSFVYQYHSICGPFPFTPQPSSDGRPLQIWMTQRERKRKSANTLQRKLNNFCLRFSTTCCLPRPSYSTERKLSLAQYLGTESNRTPPIWLEVRTSFSLFPPSPIIKLHNISSTG